MTGLKTNERLLYEVLNSAWPKQWVNEFQGIPGRKFRFDCANPSLKVAIEIEGGIWISGSHNRPVRYQLDMEKYNLATIEGWKILRYSPETLKKTPYKIIRDIRMLCGASLNDAGQTLLCLDAVKQPGISMQVKIS